MVGSTPPENANAGRRSGRGFSIPELVIVLLIVAILAGLIAPAVMSGVRQSRLNAAASQVGSALRRARNRAIATGEIHCARFVASGPPQVIVHAIPALAGVPGAGYTWTGVPTAGGVVLAEETVIDYPLPSTEQFVVFLPDGSAWGPGLSTVPGLAVRPAQDNIDHRYPDERCEISIMPLTGRIVVSDRKLKP